MPDYTKHALDAIAAANYSPTPAHIRAKETFWASFSESPSPTPPDELGTQEVAFRSSNKNIGDWYRIPGFREWFQEPNWEKLQAQANAQLAQKEIAAILMDTEIKLETKVAAAKVAREYYDRFVPKEAEKLADDEVSKMSPDQLREFIKHKTQSIK